MLLLTLSALSLAIVGAAVYFTVYLPLSFRAHYTRQGIKSVPFNWLIGQTQVIRAQNLADEPFRQAKINAAELGQVFISFFGPFGRLVVNSPPLIQDVLVKKAQLYRKPGAIAKLLYPLVGRGVLTSEGELWKRQRQLLNPAFHFVPLKAMTSLMLSSSVEAFDKWPSKVWNVEGRSASAAPTSSPSSAAVASDGSFNLEAHHAFSALTLDIIASTSFGSTFRDNPAVADKIYQLFSTILLIIQKRQLNLVGVLPVIQDLPLPNKRELDAASQELKDTVISLLSERRKGSSRSLCEGKDLLDLLLEARDSDGNPMPETLLHDELMTFVLAGHETTANLMAFMSYLLATHPAELARATAEVDSVTGGAAINYDMLKSLTYCDAVIDESLRLYPPVSFLSREAQEDHTIGPDDAPIHVRKGDVINMNVWSVHHDASIWPEPFAFKPDRFLDGAKRHPMSLLPFSGGPRACLGAQFARLEAKMILATMLQRFSMEMVPGQKIVEQVAITMRPKYGLLLKLTPRQKA